MRLRKASVPSRSCTYMPQVASSPAHYRESVKTSLSHRGTIEERGVPAERG